MLVTEIFKAKNDLNSVMKKEVFNFENLTKNFERTVANCLTKITGPYFAISFHFICFLS